MPRRLVHLWSARAKHAVIMRLPSSTLPRRAAYLSDGPTHGYHAWPPLWPKRAVCALLKTCNQLMLTRKQPYQDLGAAYFDQREQERVERRLVHRVERLGYEVSLQPRALAS